ncbi:MAG: twin-arginine translocase subunit TatC [Acidobacteriota bacterium]
MSSNATSAVETSSTVETSMSFLDHLDELRRRLTYSAIAITIAFIVCFTFSDRIYAFLDKPVREALRRQKQLQLETNQIAIRPIEELADNTAFIYAFNMEASLQGITIPAGTTLPAKLVKKDSGRVIVTASTLVVGKAVVPEGTELPMGIVANYSDTNEALVVHTLQGGFNLYVKVAFYAAIAFSVPFLLYQLWLFISPGLYQHEKVYVFPFVLMASVFFLLGAAFAYYVAFPRAIDFLLEVSQNFRALIEVNEYFDLIITIVFGLGLVFEIPTVVLFLARFGLVTPQFLLGIWRYAVIGIFLFAAILSPTSDIANMMVFYLPMLGLYLFSIGIAWLFGKPRSEPA